MSRIVKTGANSIILGNFHYNNFVKPKSGKLLKITKITNEHDEFEYLSLVREIKNYNKYYSIPDDDNIFLHPSDKFYNDLKELVKDHQMKIFTNTSLQCFYIEYAGNTDLHDIIQEMKKMDFSVFSSYSKIIIFVKHVLKGIMYLHQKKLCHLDIKPENIMINEHLKTFKIIDFGFCNKEPFENFLRNTRGTPGYFPKKIGIPEAGLPEIEANDLVPVNGIIPIFQDKMLVYKIDSFCFGRVLNFLFYTYNEYKSYICFDNSQKRQKIDNIISDLCCNDIIERITINDCYNKYFN